MQIIFDNWDLLLVQENQIEELKIDDYDGINSKLQEVKDLKKVMAELVKDGDDPQKVSKINKEISPYMVIGKG